jgi:hypothetical protein
MTSNEQDEDRDSIVRIVIGRAGPAGRGKP